MNKREKYTSASKGVDENTLSRSRKLELTRNACINARHSDASLIVGKAKSFLLRLIGLYLHSFRLC